MSLYEASPAGQPPRSTLEYMGSEDNTKGEAIATNLDDYVEIEWAQNL
jgi:hypothetical protein